MGFWIGVVVAGVLGLVAMAVGGWVLLRLERRRVGNVLMGIGLGLVLVAVLCISTAQRLAVAAT